MMLFQENKVGVKADYKIAATGNVNKNKGNGKALSAGQLKKKKAKQQRLVRAVIQLIFFISMPSAFVAGFSGVKYIFNQIGTGSVLEKNSFLLTLIGLCGFTVFGGRFFCGYVCAFGSLGDFVYWGSGLVQTKVLKRKKQYSPPEGMFSLAQKLKYLILVLIVILCTMGVYSSFSGISPWDIFSQLTAGRLNLNGYITGLILMILILAGMAVQERFFCQFLCPMGAVFALLPVFPVSILKRDEPNCAKGCTACQKKCPVHLRLDEDSLRSGECIRCGKCSGVCPRGNIHSFAGQLSGDELWMVVGKAVLFFAMGVMLGLCRFA